MRNNSPAVIRVDRERLFRWLFGGLVATEVAIVLLDAFISEFEWVSIGAAQRLFNITREDGLANFFSSFQMLAVGFVLLLITLVVRSRSREPRSRTVIGWGVITGLFFFMGIDDATKLHERIGSIFKALVSDSSGDPGAGPLGRLLDLFPSYPWQLVLGPFFLVAGLFVFVFLMRQLASTQLRTLVVVAIGLFVLAVGLDFVEGMDDDVFDGVADVFSVSMGRVVHFSKSIEEFIEMVGTTIFLFVFLKQLTGMTSSMTFEIRPGEPN